MLDIAPWTKVITNGQFSYQYNQQVSVPVNLGSAQLQNISGISSRDGSKEAFMIQPNPATDNISLTGDMKSYHTAQIFDMTGSLVKSVSVKSTTFINLDISDLPSGFYSLKLAGDEDVAVRNFIKY